MSDGVLLTQKSNLKIITESPTPATKLPNLNKNKTCTKIKHTIQNQRGQPQKEHHENHRHHSRRSTSILRNSHRRSRNHAHHHHHLPTKPNHPTHNTRRLPHRHKHHVRLRNRKHHPRNPIKPRKEKQPCDPTTPTSSKNLSAHDKPKSPHAVSTAKPKGYPTATTQQELSPPSKPQIRALTRKRSMKTLHSLQPSWLITVTPISPLKQTCGTRNI